MKKKFFLITTLIFGVFVIFSFMVKKNNYRAGETIVQISTELGNIKLKLYNQTPGHRDNFIKLVKQNVYDGTLFHRVIKGFMIQGGDPESKTAKPGQMLGNGETGPRIPTEFDSTLFHKRGALAAARDDNPVKASSSCQFYIVQGRKFTEQQLKDMSKTIGMKLNKEKIQAYTTIGGAPHLDGNYTVFGEVIEGIEVVDKIAAIEVDANNRPLKDIKVTMKILE
ncbi:MAG: peptidylprolyl isomerase [Bacteroidales bacterium]|jgi:peptidyl-prolyl cis-trans isomerase B (cyclophilin B)